MKAQLFIYPIVMMAALASAEQIALVDLSQENNGVVMRRVQHFADGDSLAKLKGWKPGEGIPAPVTRDQAVELAKAAARANGRTEFKELEMSVELAEGKLFDEETGAEIRVPRGTSLWYYRINFNKASTTWEDDYVVPMDGKVAIRIIR